MTREEILTMRPDRKLDRIIAEKIFGFITQEKGDWVKTGNYNEIIPLFEYSTEIEASWEIVKKMKEKSVYLAITTGDTEYCVGGYSEVYQDDIEEVSCVTAPEAICKAALLAVLDE